MSAQTIFQIQLVLGYIAWLLCFRAYAWPRLASMPHAEAQRAIATLHSFRFFGLAFMVPGVVGPHLPAHFAEFAGYWDLATGALALLALLSYRSRATFTVFVIAFNLVGMLDLIVDYYHAVQAGLPAVAGELGAVYAVPIVFVPLLMITHVAAVYLLVRSWFKAGPASFGHADGRQHESRVMQSRQREWS